MAELTANELAFGKRLAHVDKEIRDRALTSISNVLSTEKSLAYMDVLRHWKALFYCFWLSDKPLVQQELAWDLASLILACKGDNRVKFVRAFWETVSREWFDVDKHRVDKYLLLMRRIVFFTFKSMESSGWDENLVSGYMRVYQDYPVNPSDPRVPNSIRTHVADIYIDEIARLAASILKESEGGQGKTRTFHIPVVVLLEPFMRFIGTSTIKHLPPKIQETVFADTVVRIAEAEERASAEDNSGDGLDDSEAMDIDKNNQTGDEDLRVLGFLIEAIPEIKKRLLDISSEEGVLSLGRKRLHLIYQMLSDTFPDEESDIVFPQRIVVKEPIGAEERKQADKHKRKKENKRREMLERKKKARSLAGSVIAASADNLDVNALENLATAEEERVYQEDVDRIHEMEKHAGFDAGDEAEKKVKSKKAMRIEKKSTKKNAASKAVTTQEEIPALVSGGQPENAPAHVKGKATKTDSLQRSEGDEWVVAKKESNMGIANNTHKRKHDNESSLLPGVKKGVVIKEKGQNEAAASKARSANIRQKSRKKHLSWGLDNNLTKHFLTKVPMLPPSEPVAITEEPALKPALRKESVYASNSATRDKPSLPLKPMDPEVVTTLVSMIKRKQHVVIGNYAYTPSKAEGEQNTQH
ncbi:hypothetical protein IWW48_003229 [Coemansia sp. RSA 1200]|nr:hypothetical protein IWW48_003229 [Coemansia sp. RSA 1200]